MIKIETLQIENFRGIKRLVLELERKSLVVHGPNGSGKSGIVDAIEFALAGRISRLAGEGTSGLSIKLHGPHVDKRDDPASARVRMTVYVPRLDRVATITRTAAKHKVYHLEPDEPELRLFFDELERHPELTLSRREIIRYVLAEAGKRSKEVQALLKLDGLEQTRAQLKKAANSLRKELQAAEQAAATAHATLAAGLGVTGELVPRTMLAAVNPRRAALGLAPIEELTGETELKAGLEAGPAEATAGPSRDWLAGELKALAGLLAGKGLGIKKPELKKAARLLDELAGDPALRESLERREFVQQGLELADGGGCPLCDHPWSAAELAARLRGKLAAADRAAAIEAELRGLIERLRGAIAGLRERLAAAVTASELAGVDGEPLERWRESLAELAQSLASPEERLALGPRLAGDWLAAPPELAEFVADLRECVAALPDPGQADEAREFLIICQDRLDKYHQGRQTQERRAAQHDAAQAVVAAYDEAVESVLAGLYEQVESDFAGHYRLINQEDEAGFQARLVPAAGKLGLDVDFYDRGLFPPGAYHSEGHQDGMGLCLYLALMRQVQGNEFHFAVLDDVVMSVDKSHRKEVCNLLKTRFPGTQFVITTHEQAWAKQMQSAGLVTRKSCVMFRRWTIDHGPMVSESLEVWDEIASDLADERIPEAAGALRRHLEYVAAELSDRFQAQVLFRGDGGYELVELLPAVVSRWKFWLGRADQAGRSWDNPAQQQEVARRLAGFKEIVNTSNVEQWAINKSIHYNEWAHLSSEDFQPVVGAFRALLDQFRCAACNTWLHLSPHRGRPDTIRCDCAAVNLNLRQKG